MRLVSFSPKSSVRSAADRDHCQRCKPLCPACGPPVTGRSKTLVFNGCYHGAVDETFVKLKDGKTIMKPGLAGQSVDLTQNSL